MIVSSFGLDGASMSLACPVVKCFLDEACGQNPLANHVDLRPTPPKMVVDTET